MDNLTDLEKRILRDAEPPELEGEVEEWITKLYMGSAGQPSLANRYWWIRGLFLAAGANEADADEMMNETVFKYLGPVKSALWAAAAGNWVEDEDTIMPAVRWVAKQLGRSPHAVAQEVLYEHQHEELINRFFGIDKLTQEDLEMDWEREQILAEQDPFAVTRPSKPAPGAPLDPERLAYESPKAVITRIAKNVLIDHLRKSKAETAQVSDEDVTAIKDTSLDANPDEQVYVQEIHSRYVAGVRELPAVQRAAWILCRDPLLLNDNEAEDLLLPALTEPQAKCAVKDRPLSVKEAASLFGRDVSPDVAKAAKKLDELLRR